MYSRFWLLRINKPTAMVLVGLEVMYLMAPEEMTLPPTTHSAKPPLLSLLLAAITSAAITVMLLGCSTKPTADTANSAQTPVENTAPVPLVDDSEESNEQKKPAKSKLAAATINTAPKLTHKTAKAFEFSQENEFLGATTLKMSDAGVRIDTPNLTLIMPPGKPLYCYNPHNGYSFEIKAKSKLLLNGTGMDEQGLEQEIKNLGPDKVAGIPCTHYKVMKYKLVKGKKEKQPFWFTHIWATKALDISKSAVENCAKMTLMPASFGVPLRVIRYAAPGRVTRYTSSGKSLQAARAESKESADQYEHEGQQNVALKSESTETSRSADQSESKQAKSSKQISPGAQTGLAHPKDKAKRVVLDTISMKTRQLDTGEFALLSGFKPAKDEMELMMSGTESDEISGDLAADLESPDKQEK